MAADWSSQRGPYEPIGYFRGVAFDATLLLILAHIVAMLAAVPFIMGGQADPLLGSPSWFSQFAFTSASLPGKFWTLLTYPFVHNIAIEHVWFAIDLYFLFRFGREVERFISRPSFLALYALLVLVPPLLCLGLSPWTGSFLLAGTSAIHFSIFAAFTFIYPGVLFFCSIPARFLFWVLFAVYSLVLLAGKNWPELVHFGSCIGSAWLFLKYLGVGAEIPMFAWLSNWRARREEKLHLQRMQRHARTEQRKTQNIDAILEKISRSGMQSLTEDERRDLQKASRRLQERDSVR
jgi:hypothetical protein